MEEYQVVNSINKNMEGLSKASSKYSLTYGDEKTSHLGLDDIYLEIEERILEAIKIGQPFVFDGSNQRGNLYYSIERREKDYLLSVKEITEDTADLIKSTLESIQKLGNDIMEEIMEIMMFEDIDVDITKTMVLSLDSNYETIIAQLEEIRKEANEVLVYNLNRLQEIVQEYDSDFL